jgi:glycosyltransferase involved in cell wall biosynthesis
MSSFGKRILALNPWHGGSHRAFLDGWMKHSRHEFTVLSLPPSKWKWRMRHGAVTFATQLREESQFQNGTAKFDALFCTDMLNLAEFLGLAPQWVHDLPKVAYFHENQLTYPVREERERDLHFAFSNLTTCLAADAVWFNSAWHRDEFLNAVSTFLKRMPDHGDLTLVETARTKAKVQSPGIDSCPVPRVARLRSEPLRIAWVGRWEHDKNPELFFDSLFELESRGIDFRLCVLGEMFAEIPECFPAARERFADRIDHWGFAETREAYWQILAGSDVVVSTADHEFFGIAILEAVAAGCFPLVPKDLAYPETLGESAANVFHDQTVSGLAGRLEELATSLAEKERVTLPSMSRFAWQERAAEMDRQIEVLGEVVSRQ